jgi:hypothetical protein
MVQINNFGNTPCTFHQSLTFRTQIEVRQDSPTHGMQEIRPQSSLIGRELDRRNQAEKAFEPGSNFSRWQKRGRSQGKTSAPNLSIAHRLQIHALRSFCGRASDV